MLVDRGHLSTQPLPLCIGQAIGRLSSGWPLSAVLIESFWKGVLYTLIALLYSAGHRMLWVSTEVSKAYRNVDVEPYLAMMFLRKVMVVRAIDLTMTLFLVVTGTDCASVRGLKLRIVETILLATEALFLTREPKLFSVAVTTRASLFCDVRIVWAAFMEIFLTCCCPARRQEDDREDPKPLPQGWTVG